jgi:hypothetical protein
VLAAEVTDGGVRVVVRATNLGDRPSTHVAQAYVELPGFDDGAALAGIARIPLAAGGSGVAEIRIPREAFCGTTTRSGGVTSSAGRIGSASACMRSPPARR